MILKVARATFTLAKNMETQAEGLLEILGTAAQASANPPHLGNLIDTTA